MKSALLTLSDETESKYSVRKLLLQPKKSNDEKVKHHLTRNSIMKETLVLVKETPLSQHKKI